jgi:hypothetical protein
MPSSLALRRCCRGAQRGVVVDRRGRDNPGSSLGVVSSPSRLSLCRFEPLPCFPLCQPSAGSRRQSARAWAQIPTDVTRFAFILRSACSSCQGESMTPAGLEPALPGSVSRCLIPWATGPAARDRRFAVALGRAACSIRGVALLRGAVSWTVRRHRACRRTDIGRSLAGEVCSHANRAPAFRP